MSSTAAILDPSLEAASAARKDVRSLEDIKSGRWYSAAEIAPIYGYTNDQAEIALTEGEFGRPRKTRAGWRICGMELLKKEGWPWLDREAIGDEELLTEAEALAFLRERRMHFRKWVVPQLQYVVRTGETRYPAWALRAYSRGETITTRGGAVESDLSTTTNPTRGDLIRLEKRRRQETLRSRHDPSPANDEAG